MWSRFVPIEVSGVLIRVFRDVNGSLNDTAIVGTENEVDSGDLWVVSHSGRGIDEKSSGWVVTRVVVEKESRRGLEI